MKMNHCAGLVACSDAPGCDRMPQIGKLREVLGRMKVDTVQSPCIFSDEGFLPFSAGERARALMDFYEDSSVDMIFDISGGDLANEVLDHLDYNVIAKNPKPLWGYSDLSCLLNAVYAVTGNPGVLYQVRSLVGEDGAGQQDRFASSLESGDSESGLFDFDYEFLRGKKAEGIMIGGNIRCFLKLAGTKYMPDFEGKILVLEAYNGGVRQMVNYVSHLRQLGAFEKVSGILLGTYTQMDREKQEPTMADIILRNVPPTLPVLRTAQIGHGADSRAVSIGKYRYFGG